MGYTVCQPQNVLSKFSGGSNYVQIFENIDVRIPMAKFEMSKDRTHLLRDHLMWTCITVPDDPLKNNDVLKVLPGRPHHFKRHFVVHIAGRGLSCSPVDGIRVFIQPTCVDAANCPTILPCVSLREYTMTDLTVCKFRCESQEFLDFALVDIASFNLHAEVSIVREVCEIWFSKLY